MVACPIEFCGRSPLPDVRIDSNSSVSGYGHSGFAIESIVELGLKQLAAVLERRGPVAERSIVLNGGTRG
jgi:hypothetical protein